MNSIYSTALVIHVVGIIVMAGASFFDYMMSRQFWKVYSMDKTKAAAMEELVYKLQRFLGIGMLIILVSGITMMAYMHQVWGAQIWFRIKMGFLLLIIFNGLGMRRRFGMRLKKLLASGVAQDIDAKLPELKTSITTVQVLQMLFFIIIFVLSIFKFN